MQHIRRTSWLVGLVLLCAPQAWAAEECLRFSIEDWPVEERAYLHACIYRVYYLKSGGDDPMLRDLQGNSRMRVNNDTGEVCITDPSQPLATLVPPVAIRRMVDRTLSTARDVEAQRKLDMIERSQLRSEIRQGLQDFPTLPPQARASLEEKQKRYEFLEVTEIPWVDPDVDSGASISERMKGWHRQ